MFEKSISCCHCCCFITMRSKRLRPRLHEQIKPPLIAQILDPYEVTPDEFAQIKHTLFAQIRPGLLHTDREFKQIKHALFEQILTE